MLVDDHPVVRQGIRFSLARNERIEIVGEASDGEDALRIFPQCRPDIVLMDINLPRLNGLEATRRLCQRFPAVRVLILSAYKDGEYLKQMADCGAHGYVLKDTSPDELVRAVQTVHQGNIFYSPDVVQLALDNYTGRNPAESPTRELSKREKDVLVLIAKEQTNKQIAQQLGVSLRTVEAHREHIMQKLKIHNVAGLTKYALKQRLIRLEE